MEGWKDGRVGGKAGLRIAYSNKNEGRIENKEEEKEGKKKNAAKMPDVIRTFIISRAQENFNLITSTFKATS